MSGVQVVSLPVTPEQLEQIEAGWRICSGGTRRVTGKWAARFDSCVAEILGYEPPASYRLDPIGAES